jgi:hypothetical protein
MPEQKSNLIFPGDLKEKIRKILNNRNNINNLKVNITKYASDITNMMSNGRDPECHVIQLEATGSALLKSLKEFKTKVLIQDDRSTQELLNDIQAVNKAFDEFFKDKYLYEYPTDELTKEGHSGFYIHVSEAKINFNQGDPLFNIIGTLVFIYKDYDKNPVFILRPKHTRTSYSLTEEVPDSIIEITKEEYEKAVKDISQKAIKQVI